MEGVYSVRLMSTSESSPFNEVKQTGITQMLFSFQKNAPIKLINGTVALCFDPIFWKLLVTMKYRHYRGFPINVSVFINYKSSYFPLGTASGRMLKLVFTLWLIV